MSDYRKEAGLVAKEAGWTVRRYLGLFIGVVAILSIGGFAVSSLGLFGRTVVERKVFENSYQRDASIRARIATDEATLAEIERRLATGDLDPATRASLQAQAAAARIRIQTAEGIK